MSSLTFDRHETFDIDMTRKVMNLQRRVEDHNMDSNNDGFCPMINNLYGMFDGYLYEDTPELANQFPADLKADIVELYNEVKSLIQQ